MIDRDGICNRIRTARDEAGLTQQQMADLLNVTVRSIQLYEVERVPWEHLTLIAQVTRCEIDWLLYGTPAREWQKQVLEKLNLIIERLGED